ncbi:hypothetical protein [Catenulispora acidiphila]|uniref:hypothetical protein n=1 Tax=Catenulispora acidiphila TaxID=304895 RepID=UPI001CBBA746|nr:hypothetical protein [Catenulispora acidiphila]
MVAATAQTLCTRRCAFVSDGSRVHTIPEALATSIAATRPTCSTSTASSTTSA